MSNTSSGITNTQGRSIFGRSVQNIHHEGQTNKRPVEATFDVIEEKGGHNKKLTSEAPIANLDFLRQTDPSEKKAWELLLCYS